MDGDDCASGTNFRVDDAAEAIRITSGYVYVYVDAAYRLSSDCYFDVCVA